MRLIKLISNRKFKIFVCVFSLIVTIGGYNYVTNKNNKISSIRNFYFSKPMDMLKKVNYDFEIIEIPKPISKQITTKSTPNPKQRIIYTVTAYDLKHLSGISRGGVDLRGKNWRTIKAIAVDPKIIPLGSNVKIEFIDKYAQKYNGIYKAIDTGGAIKGRKIDLFIEDCGYYRNSQEAIDFGVRKAYVEILK